MKVLNLLLDLVCLCGYLMIIVVCLSARGAAFNNETDLLALLALKNGFLDGAGNDITLPLSSWNTSVHFCQWPGIKCGRRHQRVTSIDLGDQLFTGTLTPHVGNLTFLRFLNLTQCGLKGVVPEEVGRLSRLRVFSMGDNELQGSIPLHLMNCSKLRIFDLMQNGLTGTIPRQLGLLSKLEFLSLGQNNLTGEIPSNMGNISSLMRLGLHYNMLWGSIPSSIGKLSSLTYLSLSVNNLSGSLPSSIYNLSSLTIFTLTDNRFSGNILEKMGVSFPHLEWLLAAKNYFTGIIPPTITNISGLSGFDVGGNQLHGRIPHNIGRLTELRRFSMEFNKIGSGRNDDLNFISSFANLTNLEILGLGRNQFGGVIPYSIGNLLGNLQYLSLGGNKNIYGNIPVEIGNLINLAQLGVEDNSLTGEIPTSIGNMYKLEGLALGKNKLRGRIPSLIGNLTRLFVLAFEGNQLEGSLPSSLQRCSSLQIIYMNSNRLNGDLSLKIMSSLNQIFTLYMNDNQFTGHIPRELDNLIHLSNLDISNNKYSGVIPTELGTCLMLETLQMGGNMFTGHIPLSLSSLKSIQIMDFSRNYLSGSIPPQFQNLHLRIFNVSFNQLEGDVPRKGVFSNLSAVSLQGNKKLCGGVPTLRLSKCSSRDGKHLSPAMFIAITLSSILFLTFVTALAFWFGKRSSIVKLTSNSSMEGYLRLSYNDLLVATDQFAFSSIIGVGNFGSVYKGIISEGDKVVAVKVMDLTKHGAIKSFWRECEALGKIRHRNLLKIISCVSSLDFRGNDFMALVYEFMPNGNLDSWLYESGSLKLKQRLDIVIDIASALDYLHNHCVPQIVHCDLKPSNVLLDEDMVAHVGDFGLAKILLGPGDTQVSKEGSSTLVVKGTVGYIPPEYGMGGNVSREGDMYSYGILLLEMIIGKKPTDKMFEDGLNLHKFCKSALYERTIADVLDPHLLEELHTDVNNPARDNMVLKIQEIITALVEIGIACSMESPDERMGIGNALKELNLIKRELPASL